MEPPATSSAASFRTASRVDDYRVGPEVEARSWAPERRVYTHNPAQFGRAAEVQPDAEVDVEPALRPPPHWMLAMAGAAVAALMGGLLGGFMHI